jgi:outer membrane biosynthesis protein TonB
MVKAVGRVLASVCGAGLFRRARTYGSLRLPSLLRRASCGSCSHGYLALAGLLLVMLPLGSCSHRQAAASSPPPQPRASRAPRPQPQPPGPVSEPQTVTALPSPQPVPPEAVPDTPGPLVPPPAPETSPPPEPSPRRPVASAPPAASESVAQPEAPAAPVPQLGQMLSPDQRSKYKEAIDQAIQRAQERLDVVLANSSKLNEEQLTTIKRIRAFIRQAEDARGQDLTIAKPLADRALLLAEDLAKNFK